jgi:ADP-heptose:LPS heptosyltransferase
MITPADPHRILIVALDNLGDLVFASALTPPIHRAFPNATIDVWCKDYTSAVARLVPHVTNVIAADPFWAAAPNRPRPSVGRFLRSVFDVRRRQYDVAILSEAPWRVAAAVAAARVARRIGFARHRNSIFLSDVLAAENASKPVLAEQARLLAPLRIDSPEPRYRLEAARLGDLRERVAQRLPARFVALHPFAASRDRCVPLHEWAALAAELSHRGLPILWIGTTRELDDVRAVVPADGAAFSDRLGNATLAETAAALSLASLFVGHDSGPLHVAGAFAVPVVGVFAPGQPLRTFPQGPGQSRMLHRATPTEITASMLLREIDALAVPSAP